MIQKNFYKNIGLGLSLSFLFNFGLTPELTLKAQEVKSSQGNFRLEKLDQAQKIDRSQLYARGGQFKVGYAPLENQKYQPIEEVLIESQFFETLAATLNQVFILPSDINIVFAECGEINAFYSPDNQAIIMCYELIEDFAIFSAQYAATDEEWIKSTLGGTMYVFVHELGHALIHVLELPVVGREEDAVDQLAVIIASEAGEFGELMAIVPATQYQLRGSQADARNVPYWDEHSLDLQRYYQIICLFYGSNPSKYRTLATLAQLPGDRAQKCPAEYQKLYANWTQLLQPHVRVDFSSQY
ncbi:hypothetical protein PCC7424_2741 [Gloeothece citriformis PCC 7424]|uniref:Uncharacterized protein n=1 Tax=Gloeothece citriformis (strain PCC 7424) TaxID=65393 RepID=B7K7V7_GLOC7|nr:DUF4344 domain-containing metallopeptidase [Gloeothece citriformis]ACK71153.1 hypothetical protein PCC7424_2741 [Gloeothece citriformis PCC 7424]